MDLLGSEWDCQTAEISAYHFLFLSACTQTDTHTHSNISLLIWCMTYATELLFWRSLKRLAYFIKSFSAGTPHSGSHRVMHLTCSFFSLWSNATLLLLHNDVCQCKFHILASREEGSTLEVCLHATVQHTCAAYVRILLCIDGIFSFQLHTLSILMNMKARLLKAWCGLGVSC